MADFKKLTVDGNTYNVKDAQARSIASSALNTALSASAAANSKMPQNGIVTGSVSSMATVGMDFGSTGPTSTTTLTAGTGALQSGISLTASGVAAIKGNSNVTIDAGSNVIVSSADIDVNTNSGRIYTDDNDIFIEANDYVKLKSGGGYALSNNEIIATRPWVLDQIPAGTDPSPLPLEVPYNLRITPDFNASKKKVTLVGGSIVWNQLVNATDVSCSVDNGHKYISFISGTFGLGSSDGSAFTVDGANGDKVFDLTLMFGSTIADYIYGLGNTNGVAWFRSKFTSPTYNYDPGTLMSVSTASAVSVGFNQWDEVWELGGIDAANGQNMLSNNRIRSVNYNPMIPSTQYYVLTPKPIRVFFYTSSKEFISYVSLSSPPYSATITSPAGAAYFRWADAGNNTTYNNDTCINISHAGMNGTYKAYQSTTYTLGNVTLNGLFKLDASNNLYADGDTYEHDGTITRKYASRAYQAGDESLADAITDGTTTVYKLTTPTTETAATFDENETVYQGGTEALTDYAYEQGTRDVAIPVGNRTLYERPVIAVPVAPATPGRYLLVATVGNDGIPYYVWEV